MRCIAFFQNYPIVGQKLTFNQLNLCVRITHVIFNCQYNKNIHMLITIVQWNGTNSHTHIHNAHSGAFTRCVVLIRSITSSENISDGRKTVSELETTSDE